MKKILALLLVLAMIMSFTACTSPETVETETETGTQTEQQEKFKVGIAFATEVAPRFQFDLQYMTEVIEAAGGEVLVQWANYDQTQQENQVENLITQGIDCLILVAVSPSMVTLVEKVKAEGIPVVCYDNFIPDAPIDAYLDRDNFAGGVMHMEATMEAIGGEGNIAIVHGEPTSSVVHGFKEGYDSVLANYPNVNVVVEQYCEGYSAEKALKVAEDALTANNNDIDAFVCTADVLALGLLPAIEAAGLSGDVFVTGMDVDVAAAKAIYEGNMGISIWTDIVSCAKRAGECAVALVEGTEIVSDEVMDNGGNQVPKIFVPIIGITSENLEEWATEIAPPGWVEWDEVIA